MVNLALLNYFKRNISKYPLEALKQRSLQVGYTQKQVDEVIEALEKENKIPKTLSKTPIKTTETKPKSQITKTKPSKKEEITKKINQEYQKTTQTSTEENPEEKEIEEEITKEIEEEKPKPKIKWIKISGILSFVFLFASFTFFLAIMFTFISPAFFRTGLGIATIYLWLILSGIYYFGFIKFGEKTNSEIIRSTSIINIFLVVFYGILGIILSIYIVNPTLFGSGFFTVTGFVAGTLSGSCTGSFFTCLSQNSADIINLLNFPAWFNWIIAIFGLIVLTIKLLFAIGLTRTYEKYTKIAGYSNMGLVFLSLIGFIFSIYLLLNPASLHSAIKPSTLTTIKIFSTISIIVIITTYLFEGLALLNASKKFENQEQESQQ